MNAAGGPLRVVIAGGGVAALEVRHARVVAVDPDQRVVETDDGSARPYDALLVALGAHPREAVPGALTFTGPESRAELDAMLEQALAGGVFRIVFALPAGSAWPLPLYELALLTSSFLVDHGTVGVEVVLVTPEERPLALFGSEASDAIAELLSIRGVDVRLPRRSSRRSSGFPRRRLPMWPMRACTSRWSSMCASTERHGCRRNGGY